MKKNQYWPPTRCVQNPHISTPLYLRRSRIMKAEAEPLVSTKADRIAEPQVTVAAPPRWRDITLGTKKW